MNEIPLSRFLEAMASEWVVERYSVDDSERLRIHYICKDDPDLKWSHTPYNELSTIPKIGTVGLIGFVSKEDCLKFAPKLANGGNQ